MGLRTTMTRGVAAMAAGALPLWLTAQPAAAFEVYSKQVILDHTFTDNAGDEVTCSVQYQSDLFRPDANSTFSADTSTQVLQFDPLAGDECRASVGVEIAYRDPRGVLRHARAFGTELADLQIDEVQGNYEATHLVFFLNCSANCDTTFTTHPK
jgi:hypothetical protein